MNRNRVSPFGENPPPYYSYGEEIEKFNDNYDDALNSVVSGENIPTKKNPIIDNVNDSVLRRRRSRRSARKLRRRQQLLEGESNEPDVIVDDDDDDDCEDDLRTRIEQKKGPGHWTPFLHERRSVQDWDVSYNPVHDCIQCMFPIAS